MDTPGTAALPALRGADAIPAIWLGRCARSGLGAHSLEWGARGKASSDSGLGPSLGTQAWPCTIRREESTFYTSLGYLPSSPGCSQSLAINNKQKNLIVLQSLTLPPLGGKFTCGKVPAHAGVMLRCNNGGPARFGDGGALLGPGEHGFSPAARLPLQRLLAAASAAFWT